MITLHPPRWIVDRTVWLRHRFCRWLFGVFGAHASLPMLALLLGPAWIVNLVWLYCCVSWGMSGGEDPLARFLVMVAAMALPTQVLFSWTSKLCRWIDIDQAQQLGLLARTSGHFGSPSERSSGLPWNPVINIEGWMVHWAFEEDAVRRAQASGLHCKTSGAKSDAPRRRL